MSEEFELECLIHKDIQHIQVRNDFLRLYQGNEVKAKIIRILETWTNTKRAEWYKKALDAREQKHPIPDMDLWVTMSYQQFSLFMYGTVKQETIKKNVKELLAVGDITSRPHPEYPYGPPQYHLNTSKIQEGLNKLPSPYQLDPLGAKIPPPPTLTPSQGVHLPRPRGYKQGGGGGKDTPTQGAKIPPFLESTQNHLDNSEITTQEGVLRDAAGADITDTPVIHPLYPFLSFDDLEHPAVMTIVFEDDDRAELTNEGYGRIAQEVVADLEAKGITVQVRTEHRKRIAVIDTTHTEVSHVDGLSGEDIRGCTGDHHHSSTHGSSLHALGEMGGQTTPGTTTQVQAQEASMSDSCSHATPEDPLPSVSFLEASTVLETGRNMGAAGENEYHSQCVHGSDTATPQERAAQGATHDARDSLADVVLVAGDGAAGDHRRPVVGDIHGAHGHRAGPEGQSVLRASNPAVQRPDGDSPSPGPASHSAGERRTGERGARPDTGDDRPVVPNGAAGNRVARGRGGKGTGVAAQGGGNRRTPKPPEPEVQLTLGGSQVREWYETIRETRIRLTAGNKRALNGLAECDGMTFDNLKDVIEYLDKHELVKKRGLVVDLQTLEKPDYYFNFEKTLQVVQRNRRGKSEVHRQKIAQEQAANDIYSIASIYRDHGVPIPSA